MKLAFYSLFLLFHPSNSMKRSHKSHFHFCKSFDVLSSESRTFVLYEIGLSAINFTIYPDTLKRANQHFWSHAKRKFDVRWFSGAWADLLPGNSKIDIEQCTQPLPGTVTKEFELSSEHSNMTLKVSDLQIKIPAPLSIDLRKSSDVVISFEDIMVVVSSALPRLFLSDHIFDAHGDGDADIPINATESNFRVQTTINGFSIEASPSFPLCNHSPRGAQKILHSQALTFLVSIERMEVDDLDKCHNVFVSVLLHYIQFNIDLEVLSGAANTLEHYAIFVHGASTNDNLEQLQILNPSQLLTYCSYIVCLSLIKIDCHFWQRQIARSESEEIVIPVNPLLHLGVEMIELGLKLDNRNISVLPVIDSATTNVEHSDVVVGKLGKLRLSILQTSKTDTNAAHEEISQEETDILCIEEIDSDSNKAFQFRICRKVSSKTSYIMSIHLNSSILRIGNDLDDTIATIAQSASNPELFRWLKPFAIDQKDVPVSITMSQDFPESKLFSFFSMDPTLIDAIILTVNISDIFLAVPLLDTAETKTICVVCEVAQLRFGYLNGKISKDLETEWLAFFRDLALGFHYSVSSTQRISLLGQQKTQKKTIMEAPTLINSFEFKSNLHPFNIVGSFTHLSISSTRELMTLDMLQVNLQKYRDRFIKLRKSVSSASTLVMQENITISTRPISIACQRSKDSIETAYAMVEKLDKNLSLFKEKFDSSIEEIRKIHSNIFKKEMDRVSAFALLTNDTSGYIMMGSTSFSNQRVVATWSFWRYWAVLKKNNLILYVDPCEVSGRKYICKSVL